MEDPKTGDESTYTLPIPETESMIEDHNENENENEKENENENENENETENEKKKPLLDEETVKIEIEPDKEGEDTPTLPLPDRKKETGKEKAKLPKYLFPFTRINDAWRDSSNVLQFLGRATCIIFETVGWFTCVGGIPFFSIVMLIIGSIYLHDCNIEPNIPIYLIVSGVFGTIQHFLAIWIKNVPKEVEGRTKVYRSYIRLANGLLHLFLIIWFILGCVWVYGSHSTVEFQHTEKDEYCHKTLYYFAFWVLNLSFILIGLLLVLTFCFFLCIMAMEK